MEFHCLTLIVAAINIMNTAETTSIGWKVQNTPSLSNEVRIQGMNENITPVLPWIEYSARQGAVTYLRDTGRRMRLKTELAFSVQLYNKHERQACFQTLPQAFQEGSANYLTNKCEMFQPRVGRIRSIQSSLMSLTIFPQAASQKTQNWEITNV